MKGLSISAAALLVFCVGLQANAQQDDGLFVIPVEIYACKYNEGQGPGTLDKAVAAWNKFMDSNNVDTYSGWTLTKEYFGADQDFDFLWMGAWKSGNAMGAGTDMWLSTGGEIAAMFQKVATCSGHSGSASVNHKMPPDGNNPGTGVLTYSDCKMKDGVRYSQVTAATREWAEILTAAGSTAAIYDQFPVYGGGDEDFDFKRMYAYANHAEMGADFERQGNGQLYMKSGELFRHLIDCDSARVYNAQNRRFVKLR